MIRIGIVLLLLLTVELPTNAGQKMVSSSSIDVYKKSYAYKGAKAIQKQQVEKINSFFTKNPDLLDYQDKRYQQSLLLWAVKNDFPLAVQTLLKLGADPDLQARDGTYAIVHAAANPDGYLLSVLLENGADATVVSKSEPVDRYQPLRTPLIAAAAVSLNNVKLLVEAGVDIDYFFSRFGLQHALVSAFKAKKMDIIKYLIIEKKINLDNLEYVTRKGDSTNVLTHLRSLVYPLDSKDYKEKMEVVNYLLARKINYWEAKVPRNLYHNFSAKFLKQY